MIQTWHFYHKTARSVQSGKLLLGLGDAWMGAVPDIAHDVQMGCMDDAQMGAMTDVMHDVWMDCMDDVQIGALNGIMYNVLTDGDFTGVLYR